MLGKQQLQITGAQLSAGLATSDYLADGGIGIESQNINLLYEQGVAYATAVETITGLANALVATCEDFENPTAENRWAFDTGGTVYYMDGSGTVHTGLTIGSTSGVAGVSDMAAFDDATSGASALYLSVGNDICQVTGTVAAGLSAVNDFWSNSSHLNKGVLVNGAPHPLLVYQNLLWIGDANNLHNIQTHAAGGAGQKDVLTLDVNEQIYSLGIDPGTGLMMIGVRSTTNDAVSAQTPAKSYIYLYDGFSAKAVRKVPISGTPFSFTAVGGQIAVGIDNSVGIWNGNGVTFMRRLGESSVPYKHRVTAINNLLFVADGLNVLCYGDIQNGKKVWTPYYTNISGDANPVNVIFQQQEGQLGISHDGTHVSYANLFDTGLGAGSGVLYTPVVNFPRPVYIRHMRVFTTGITTTGGIGGIGIINENQLNYQPVSHAFVVDSTIDPKYVFDFNMGGQKLQSLQPYVQISGQTFGVIKVIIYYDTAE